MNNQIIFNGNIRQRLKFICKKIFTGKTPVYDFENTEFLIIGQKNNQNGRINISEPKYAKKEFYFSNSKDLFLQKGDIVLNSLGGGSVGRIGFFDLERNDILTDGHPIIFRVNEDNNKKFIFYALLNEQSQLEFLANGSTNQCFLNIGDVWNFEIPCPPIDEQEKIAEFLDKKCEIIDKRLENLKQKISALKEYKKSLISECVTKGLNNGILEFRDSGIPWIGRIPKHWEVKKGKYIFTNPQKAVKDDDEVITCFRDGEVTLRSCRREDGFTISLKEIGYQGIDKGDLVIHGMDGFAGAIGISQYRGKCSPVLNILETKNSKKFYMYLLRSMAFRGIFEALATGIRVRTCDTNWSKLKNIFYILPPLDEQKEIAEFLDKKCASIDKVNANYQSQITTLKEYKKTVIYEYVTGKKGI